MTSSMNRLLLESIAYIVIFLSIFCKAGDTGAQGTLQTASELAQARLQDFASRTNIDLSGFPKLDQNSIKRPTLGTPQLAVEESSRNQLPKPISQTFSSLSTIPKAANELAAKAKPGFTADDFVNVVKSIKTNLAGRRLASNTKANSSAVDDGIFGLPKLSDFAELLTPSEGRISKLFSGNVSEDQMLKNPFFKREEGLLDSVAPNRGTIIGSQSGTVLPEGLLRDALSQGANVAKLTSLGRPAVKPLRNEIASASLS